MHRQCRQILEKLSFYPYLIYWWKAKAWVLGGAFLFGALAGVLSFFTPDEYLSEAEFIPPVLQKLPLNAGGEVIPGEYEDIDQLIAYLSSEQMKGKIVREFDIMRRYKIPKDLSPRQKSKRITAIIDQNVKITKTRNATIQIKTYDISADTAYQLNLFLLKEAEAFCQRTAKYKEYLENSIAALDSLKAELRLIEKTLADFRTRYKVFTLSDAQEAPTQTAIQLMLRNPESLERYDQVVSLETRLRRLQELYVRLYERIDVARLTVSTYPNLLFMIQEPYKAEFPDRPKRLRSIALASLIGFLAFSGLGIYAGILGLLEPAEQRQERELVS